MRDLSRCVSHNPLLGSIQDVLPRGTCLVGGCIRDMLLGRDPIDYDLVSLAPVEGIARDIARRLGSRPFWMDEKRGVMRIVMKPSGVSIDISAPKGPDIVADLMARDLTINAMAWDVAEGAFLDPAGGMADLKNGVIRIISEGNLLDDPLRALRAVRFSVTLGFAIQEDTSRMIRKHRDLLRQVSPERIRLEFSRALDTPHSAKFFRLMTWAGIIPILFPPELTGREGQLWHPVFSVALPVSEEMDAVIHAADALMPGCRALLDEETESEVKRSTMLRLSAFLMGLSQARALEGQGKESGSGSFAEQAGDFCEALRFSSHSCRMLRESLAAVEAADSLLSRDDADGLDLYRFCEGASPVLPEALLLSLAWSRTSERAKRQTASQAWEYFRNVYRGYKENPLITGRDVVDAGVSGPRVGRLLAEVEEARARGVVETKSDALAYLHRIAS
jgi:poly(A) polymerase